MRTRKIAAMLGGASQYEYHNAQAAAWAERLSSPLSNNTAALYDQLFTDIGDIITDNMDGLWVMATETREAAKLNLVGDIFNLVEIDPIANMKWVEFSGYTSIAEVTSATPNYLKTGIFPSNASLKFKRNDASMGLVSTSYVGTRGAAMGDFYTTAPVTGEAQNFIGLGIKASAGGGSRLNSAGTRTSPWFGNAVHAAVSRTDSAGYARYSNSGLMEITSAASAPIESSSGREIWIMARNISEKTSLSNHAAAWVGNGLDAIKVSRLYYALNAFLAAVGAEPLVIGESTTSLEVV